MCNRMRNGSGVAMLLLAFAVVLPGLPPGAAAQSPSEYTQDTLESFAAARLKVEYIREEYTPRIEAAQTREQARQLQQEGNARMVQAINEQGLDVPTYNEIAQAMRQDEELRTRVTQLIEAIQG